MADGNVIHKNTSYTIRLSLKVEDEKLVKQFIIDIIKLIKEHTGVKYSYYKHKNNVFESKTESYSKSHEFLKWIYLDCEIYIERKYKRALELGRLSTIIK